VEAATFAPAEHLADVVECFWLGRWDLRGQEPHRMEILSDPCVNIAFEEGRSRVVGVSTRLFRRELAGLGLVRAVKLRAGAARAVIAEGPIARFSDRMVPLGEVFDDAADIEARILGIGDDRQALLVLQDWITALAGETRDPRIAEATRAMRLIADDPGVVSATQVAEATGMTIRPLQRLFREYVGASPKWVIRRHRLQEAAVRLERDGGGSLAALAAELGYADHAHLSRDFKMATGRSPSEFAPGGLGVAGRSGGKRPQGRMHGCRRVGR
jgi:AraC-like DNA-binding protein